jgi:dephospho-CoA kinase
MFCVGLTGGIGAGKTLASDLFAALGADIIDTDVIARQLLMPDGALYPAVVKHFGDSILNDDQHINRKALRHHIFNHPNDKKWLESHIHPLIRTQAKAMLDASSGPYVIMVIPLLSQANRHEYPFLNRVCVIEASHELQISRTMARDHMTHEAAEKIIAHQAPAHERIALAHDVIENNGDKASVEAAIRALHERYLLMSLS